MQSEFEPQGKFNDPRVAGAGNLSKVWRPERSCNVRKVGVIKDVEKLTPKLELLTLSDLEIFVKGHVKGDGARASDRTWSGVPKESCGRRGKRAGIKPL